MSQAWDDLSNRFNAQAEEIDPHVADNVVIACPIILDQITRHFEANKNIDAIDYGCGTGYFAEKLSSLGLKVIGLDISEKMIEIAKGNIHSKVRFYVKNFTDLSDFKQVDVISSVMVFQFISNIEEALKVLCSKVNPGGLVIFAVFNPDYVNKDIATIKKFKMEESGEIFLDLNSGTRIPVFIRDSKYYDKIIQRYGYKKILESYPPFTPEFIQKYKPTYLTEVPEFMILGYVREK
jgi:2-polyprenyl-3-methyl-5-hydroxy-6-metoxy-1,4-benzoquinol methylase